MAAVRLGEIGGVGKPVRQRVAYEFGGVGQVHLLQDVRLVRADGLDAQGEFDADFCQALALNQHVENLILAIREQGVRQGPGWYPHIPGQARRTIRTNVVETS